MNFKLKVSEYSITQITEQELQWIHTFLIQHRDGVTCFLNPHRRDVASEETNGQRKAWVFYRVQEGNRSIKILL